CIFRMTRKYYHFRALCLGTFPTEMLIKERCAKRNTARPPQSFRRRPKLTKRPGVLQCAEPRASGNDGGVAPDCKSGTMKRSRFESYLAHIEIERRRTNIQHD